MSHDATDASRSKTTTVDLPFKLCDGNQQLLDMTFLERHHLTNVIAFLRVESVDRCVDRLMGRKSDRCSTRVSKVGICNLHSSSLSGYGADHVSAPMTTAEAATSVVGDIVRDGTDKTAPESFNTSVESSVATGAAAREGSQQRPHPKSNTDTGSDQR